MCQKLIASQCTRCSRPLTDPVSISCGVGPLCRKMMGMDIPDIEKSECLRRLCTEVNIRSFQGDFENALIALNGIFLLGYPLIHDQMLKAVRKIAKKSMPDYVLIQYVDDKVRIFSPYNKDALDSWRKLLMRWNKDPRCYEGYIAQFDGHACMAHLREFYHGTLTMGVKGVFWPGVHEKPVKFGDDGFEGVVDGKPRIAVKT